MSKTIENEALKARDCLTKLRKLLWFDKGHAYQCGYVDGAKAQRELMEHEIKSLTENLKALRELSPYSTEPITYTVPSTNYTIRVPAGCVLQQMENGSYSVFMKETIALAQLESENF
jgi:hypothetical protein